MSGAGHAVLRRALRPRDAARGMPAGTTLSASAIAPARTGSRPPGRRSPSGPATPDDAPAHVGPNGSRLAIGRTATHHGDGGHDLASACSPNQRGEATCHGADARGSQSGRARSAGQGPGDEHQDQRGGVRRRRPSGGLRSHGRRDLGQCLRVPGQGHRLGRLRAAERGAGRASRKSDHPGHRRGGGRAHDCEPGRGAHHPPGRGGRRLWGRRGHRAAGRGLRARRASPSSSVPVAQTVPSPLWGEGEGEGRATGSIDALMRSATLTPLSLQGRGR